MPLFLDPYGRWVWLPISQPPYVPGYGSYPGGPGWYGPKPFAPFYGLPWPTNYNPFLDLFQPTLPPGQMPLLDSLMLMLILGGMGVPGLDGSHRGKKHDKWRSLQGAMGGAGMGGVVRWRGSIGGRSCSGRGRCWCCT